SSALPQPPHHGAPMRLSALLSALGLTLNLVACEHDGIPSAPDLRAGSVPQLSSFDGSEWSPPVNLGPTINTSANEVNAALSPDGLSLYFTSDRPGGLGGNDIWVSHRDCDDCLWGPPANLGAPIN